MNLNHSASDLQHFNTAHEGLNGSPESLVKAIEGFSMCFDKKFSGTELSSLSALA